MESAPMLERIHHETRRSTDEYFPISPVKPSSLERPPSPLSPPVSQSPSLSQSSPTVRSCLRLATMKRLLRHHKQESGERREEGETTQIASSRLLRLPILAYPSVSIFRSPYFISDSSRLDHSLCYSLRDTVAIVNRGKW